MSSEYQAELSEDTYIKFDPNEVFLSFDDDWVGDEFRLWWKHTGQDAFARYMEDLEGEEDDEDNLS